MADIAKVRRNVIKLRDAGVPDEDIDQYIAEEGTTFDEVKNFKEVVQEKTATSKGGEAEALKTALGIGAGMYGAGKVIKGAGKAGQYISEYPYRKTLAIRKGLLEKRKTETSAYGKTLRTISKTSTDLINPSDVLERMEVNLKQKGILDISGKKVGVPSTEIDRQYLKSYDELMNKFAKSESGEIPVSEILQTSRNVKAKGGKTGTYRSKLAGDLSDDIMESIKPQIKQPEFKQANIRYAKYKEIQNPLEEIFKPFEGKYKTARGEKALTDIYGQSIGTKKALQRIPEVTGQKIRGAKVLSRAKQANPLNWLRGGKILGLLGVYPQVGEAVKFSKSPGAYLSEQLSGIPQETLIKAREAFQKSKKGEKLSKEEEDLLVNVGVTL